MDKKKILIVSEAFLPRISPRSTRATELAKEFSIQGHDVTVITRKRNYNYSRFLNKYPISIKPLLSQRRKKKIGNNKIKTKLLGLLHYLFLYPGINITFQIDSALREETGYDLVISIAVPYTVHWGVAIAIRKNNQLTNVWVADCGDPFIGYGHGRKRPFYFKFVDDWFLNNAEIITLPYKELLKYYSKKYYSKIRFIPQGFDFNKIKLCSYQKNPVPTFAYSGIFMKDFRDPRLFLDYLSTLSIEFKFIIYTRNSELLSGHLSTLKNKIEIRNYVPRTELIKELSKMDFLINIQNGNKNDYPSKLIDYTITQRPILNINSYKLNINGIQEFLNGEYKNYDISLVDIDQYNIKNVAKKFLDLY